MINTALEAEYLRTGYQIVARFKANANVFLQL